MMANIPKNIQDKLQAWIYMLTKEAASFSYADFLEHCNISDDEYEQIKKVVKDRLNVEPYV